MAYYLNQYVQSDGGASASTYMTQITDGSASTYSGVNSRAVSSYYRPQYSDKCVKVSLNSGIPYYFHAKIKRLNKDQEFYIYLINTDNATVQNGQLKSTQFLKDIVIKGGDINEWVDVEIVFSPLLNFNTILFKKVRDNEDYQGHNEANIIYQELSKIVNIIGEVNTNETIKSNIIKAGIQARPGTILCINGEEIHVGENGIYELNNGIVSIDFLGIVQQGYETGEVKGFDSFEAYLADLTNKINNPPEDQPSGTGICSCIFDTTKERKINGFIIDYMTGGKK